MLLPDFTTVFATTIYNNIGEEFSEVVSAVAIWSLITTFLKLLNILTSMKDHFQMRITPKIVHQWKAMDFNPQTKPSSTWLVKYGECGGWISSELWRYLCPVCGSMDHNPYWCTIAIRARHMAETQTKTKLHLLEWAQINVLSPRCIWQILIMVIPSNQGNYLKTNLEYDGTN